MARVYLETSFVSACVTDRKDAGSVYRREKSLEWWALQAQHHEIFVSSEVITELSQPAFRQREQALKFIQGLPVLQINPRVLEFARILIDERVMPQPVTGDASHVAVSAVSGIEYVLSWNVQHLANPNKVTHLTKICAREGFVPPRIMTPESLWEDDDES
jgi:hypothetical protein